MKNIKTETLQIRVTEIEKNIIKNKADILDMSITDYVIRYCIFNNITKMFVEELHKKFKD